jgi:hypothetical protein
MITMNRQTVLTIALLCAWFVPVTGSADTFAMSSVFQQYCCDQWTNDDATPTPAPNPGGGAPLLRGGVIANGGTVAHTVNQVLGTAPYQLTIPTSRVGTTTMAPFPLPHPSPLFDSVVVSFSNFNEPGVFAAGGGPGEFEFCPESVGPAVGACGAPISATQPGGLPYHGRISVTPTPGGNQFGGSMRLLGDIGGLPGGALINARNAPGGSATQWTSIFLKAPFSIIGAGSAANPVVKVPFNLTQIYYSTSAKNSSAFLSSITTPGRATGHMWTTGMVTASITAQAAPPYQAVTMTGGDTRITTGPDAGSGNVTLVSANFYQNLGGGPVGVRGNTLSMDLPEPGMALGICVSALALIFGTASRRRQP